MDFGGYDSQRQRMREWDPVAEIYGGKDLADDYFGLESRGGKAASMSNPCPR